MMVKADQLFRQFGFGKTTVAEIAAELAMSPANIYKFFSSKEAIIQASADRNLVALTEAVHQHVAGSGSLRCSGSAWPLT
jgi:AcrR family transcriptional regulator